MECKSWRNESGQHPNDRRSCIKASAAARPLSSKTAYISAFLPVIFTYFVIFST